MKYSLYVQRPGRNWTLSVQRNTLTDIEAMRAKYVMPGCQWSIVNNETGEIAKGGVDRHV